MFGGSEFALIPDHKVRAAKLTNRWISRCWWGRDASSDEHLVGTKHGLLKCRSVRRKPPGEQWSRRETVEARGTKWNFDVEWTLEYLDRLWNHVEMKEQQRQQQQHRKLRHNLTVMNLRRVEKECTRRHSGPSGQKSAELLVARHGGLPVPGSHTLVNAKRTKMPGTRVVEQHRRRERNVELLPTQIHDHWTQVQVRWILSRRGRKRPL